MTERLPAWIYKRDGRLVPFEADKISRALFAATECVGRPDAFMARELTDGVVHFLAAEAESSIPSTAQVSDLVIKVVRELGQAALSQAFADFAQQRLHAASMIGDRESTIAKRVSKCESAGQDLALVDVLGPVLDPQSLAWRLSGACLRAYCLRQVFTRDLVAAHTEGLLTLGGLEAPLELAGCALGAAGPTGLVEAVAETRRSAGILVASDGPEYVADPLHERRLPPNSSPQPKSGFPHPFPPPPVGEGKGGGSGREGTAAAAYARELAIGLRATGLIAVVNLNVASPPFWADDLAAGPLFAEARPPRHSERLRTLTDELLEQLFLQTRPSESHNPQAHLRIDWHLSERDFTAEAEGRLLRLARRALAGEPLAFVLDRQGRPVPLAEGLDRRHPAVLLTVGLHLQRLARQAAGLADPAVYLQKLESLARLALSAGAQKRAFLRRRQRGWPGFLLNRARLVVVPVGLDALVRELFGQSLSAGGPGLGFARLVIDRLRQVLQAEAQAYHLEACLDSAPGFRMFAPGADAEAAGLDPTVFGADSPLPPAEQVAGLTPWDATAAPTEQLQAASALHAAAEAGTAALLVPEARSLSPEELVHLLHYAWDQTQVVRLRLMRTNQHQRQLLAPWAGDR